MDVHKYAIMDQVALLFFSSMLDIRNVQIACPHWSAWYVHLSAISSGNTAFPCVISNY